MNTSYQLLYNRNPGARRNFWLWVLLGVSILAVVVFLLLVFIMGITVRQKDIGDEFELAIPCKDAVYIVSKGINLSELNYRKREENYPYDYQSQTHEEYTYENPYCGITQLILPDGNLWVKYYVYPSSDNKTTIVLNMVSNNEFFNDRYLMDSTKLGFNKSRQVRIAFENQILDPTGVKWKNTTFFMMRLGPAYMWLFNLLSGNSLKTY